MRIIACQDDIAEGLHHLSAADPVLARMVEATGEVPLRRSAPGFESLVSVVVAQQVSKQAGDAIQARLERVVKPLTPQNFLSAGPDVWREAGLSRPKQRTIAAISEAVSCGALDLHHMCALPAAAAIAAMTAVKGIGPWTAEVYLLFAAGHPDIFPAGDVALQNVAQMAWDMEVRPADKALRAMAERWSPWRGVAARLFWAYYAIHKGREVAPSIGE